MRENELPCPYTILDYNGLLKISLPGVLKRLRKLIVEEDFQILQTFFEDSIFVAWLATRFIGHDIVLLSSRRDMGLGEGNQPWYHRVYGLLLPLINRDFDGIVANSQQVKSYVANREKAHSDKIEVIYNGVDLPNQPDPPQIHNQSKNGEIIIAIVASLTPVKRHDVLIEAVSLIKPQLFGTRTNIKVIALGQGPEKERLEFLTRQLQVNDLFHFQGAVTNVSDYLSYVDIGVLCSDREGLSNAILEYMASGLPVVATEVGGNIEMVSDLNGRCVPADDPDALACALCELILDRQKRERMGGVSRKKVLEDFSWQRSLDHLESYYLKLTSKRGMTDAG